MEIGLPNGGRKVHRLACPALLANVNFIGIATRLIWDLSAFGTEDGFQLFSILALALAFARLKHVFEQEWRKLLPQLHAARQAKRAGSSEQEDNRSPAKEGH